MKIFAAGKNKPLRRAHSVGRETPSASPNRRTAGNVFFALFAAVAMVGAVGYGFNTVLRGPISNMTDVTRRTVAESTVVTSSRVAIVGATTQQGTPDCDADGFVEPIPYRDAGAATHPTGGGYLPTGLINDTFDPWKTEYGYCAWDAGPKSVSDNVVACGGLAAKRLQGSPDNKQYSVAIISAGKDKKFQTTCSAYNGASPNASLITRTPGSDDIVLGYTYAEANDLGAGMWRPSQSVANTAETRNALEGTKDATFTDKVVLQGNVLTGGGLVLPGDPGDDSLTGPCNSANDKQIRRNLSTTPPTLEICNFSSGLGWSALSGTSSSTGNTTGMLVSHWAFDEGTGTTAADTGSAGNNGSLDFGPQWIDGGISGKALRFNGTTSIVTVPDSTSLKPTNYSFALWFKGSAIAWGQTLLEKQNHGGPSGGYGLWLTPTLRAFTITTDGYTYVDGPSVSNNQWYHVAYTYDGSNISIYVNGQIAATAPITGTAVHSTEPFGIGRRTDNSMPFAGDIDEVLFYNYALTDAEVYELYNSTKKAVTRNTTPAKKGRIVVWGSESNSEFANGAATGNYQSPSSTYATEDYVQISAGINHACGVRAGGTVWCWGNDSNGKLGNGAAVTVDQSAPNMVQGLTDVVMVSTGDEQTCALKRDGTAWCWGDNTYYQLGDGTNTGSAVPVQVADITDFVDISTGYRGTCGLRISGEADCWGAGTTGLMGNGTNVTNQRPGPVSTVTDFTTIHLSHMYAYACGATKSGKGYCWGQAEQNGNYGDGGTTGAHNTPEQISNITDFVDVQLVNTHGCGIRASGEVWCWGNDSFGKLGNGSSVTVDQTVPVKADTINDAIQLNVMKSGTCVLRASGEVWCWGSDSNGKIGNGPAVTANKESPVQSNINNIVYLTGHYDGIYAIMDPSVVPPKMTANGTGKLSTDILHTCAIDDDGTAWCWGQDGSGQLGNGATAGLQAAPSAVSDTGPWMQIATGDASIVGSTCGIKFDSKLWCWGSDGNGQIGNGATTTTDQVSPVVVNSDWVSIEGGTYNFCGIKKDGKGYCWGLQSRGAVGNGVTAGNATSPAMLSIGAGGGIWKKLAVGSSYACGILENDTAWCWGVDDQGQLGNGSGVTGDKTTPYAVADAGPWADISAGGYTACGIKMDGSLWCWGMNSATSTVGVNDTTSASYAQPVMVHEPGPWAKVSVGKYVSSSVCAIKVDGSLWCWGSGANGRLGNKATTNETVPKRVYGGGNDWIAVTLSSNNTCAMKKDHSVWCWGTDTNGILGNGPVSSADQTVPARVMNMQHRTPFTASADGGGLNMLPGLVANIGTVRLISADGAANSGFGFTGSGRSVVRAASTGEMALQVFANGNMASAQLGLKTTSATAVSAMSVIGSYVAYWGYGAGSGTTVADSSGNGNNATMEDGAGWSLYGVDNSAGTFDAVDDAAQAPNSVSLQSTTELSVNLWVYKNTLTGADDIIAKATENGAYDWYLKSVTGALSFAYNGGPALSTALTPLKTGQWQNIGVTYSTTAQTAKIYVDGMLVMTKTGLPAMTLGTHPLRMGETWAGEGLDGMLDGVRIYDRVLSDMDMQNLYLAGYKDNQLTRLIGLDYVTGNFEIARDGYGSQWLTSTFPDLELTYNGDVGLGTLGAPQAKLDVNGAIKIANDAAACAAGKSGTIRWTGTGMEYCDGSTWKTWKSFAGIPYQGARKTIDGNCAIRGDGTAWCWGNGWMGNGVTNSSNLAPVQVQTDTGPGGWNDWIQISSDGYHVCGLRVNGTMWCWGEGSYGALGVGTWTESLRPVQVKNNLGGAGWSDWVQVTAGAATGGGGKTCGIRTNGSLWCWGNLTGDGSSSWRNLPVQVKDSTGTSAWSDWVQVSSGYYDTCGIRVDGSAWCWGENFYGTAGDGTSGAGNTPRLLPVQVVKDAGAGYWYDWRYLATQGLKTCGLRSDGAIYCWGHSGSSQLGAGWASPDTSRPYKVADNTGGIGTGWNDWIFLAEGALVNHHGCGIRADGSAWCWGGNYSGQTGGTPANFAPQMVKTDTGAAGWNDWIALSLHADSTCGVRANGAIYCWGAGTQIGTGTGANTNLPVKLIGSP